MAASGMKPGAKMDMPIPKKSTVASKVRLAPREPKKKAYCSNCNRSPQACSC